MIHRFTTRKGHYFLVNNKAVVFGNKHLTWEDIEQILPFPVFQTKQIHSDIGVAQPLSELAEADAHWIAGSNVGLGVYTADCAPLILIHPEKDNVAAFHCGWRGVASKIFEKNLSAFEPHAPSRKSLLSFLGPHILWESFEVQKDVGLKILEGLPTPQRKMQFVREKENGKWLIDLRGILKEQVQSQGLRLAGEIHQDTFRCSRYYSARRKDSSKERQWSLALVGSTPHEIEVLVAKLMA